MMLTSFTIFLLVKQIQNLAYNQPKFCSNSTWNPNATTITNQTQIGSDPFALHINTNNSIYAVNRQNGRILIWLNNSTVPHIILYAQISSRSIFVTINDDIYVSDSTSIRQIVKSNSYTNNTKIIGTISYPCTSLFVDINNTLYCSMFDQNKVVKKWLNDNQTTMTTVVGNGSAGLTSNMLNGPNGIYVDTNFDLYVADCVNDRIQLFGLGQSNGTTIQIKNSANTTIAINCPFSVMLDGNKYLFITDQSNNRVLGSDENGFRCIAGCSNSNGAASYQLYNPLSAAFDSFGNLFVVDATNHRIQKFRLSSKLCNYETTTNFHNLREISTTEQITTTTRTTNEMCKSPNLFLIPSGSTLTNRLQFRRSQDFSIISLIEFNCNDSLSIKTQWIIKNCTSTITCSIEILLDPLIETTFSEIYIPAKKLSFGTYEFQLIVTMMKYSNLKTSSSVYIDITPSGITANLVQLGTSMITSGFEQDLKLDPGTYSIDFDENTFDQKKWFYKYYCRIYPTYKYPNFKGDLMTIDDQRNDSSNPSCLSNRTGFIFDHSYNSSLTILSKALQSNRTYQFMVQMTNRRNASQKSTGYVLVKIEDTRPLMIAIGCVIVTLCAPNLEYQFVNPTTQVALFSIPIGNYSQIKSINWNVFSGEMNSSHWTLFNQNSFENLWFFGRTTSNFTSTNQLFLNYPSIKLWKFEVIYTFPNETSVSALNFIINQPPQNGSCSISPVNGTILTLFTISCIDWFDDDGIKDYSLYSQNMIVAYSNIPSFQVYLSSGDNQNLFVEIRDQLNCLTQSNLSTISIESDSQILTNKQLFSTGNQNVITQLLTSISQEFNKMNTENLNRAASTGIPLLTISISSLTNPPSQSSSNTSFNQSAFIEFTKNLNSQASIREYFISFTQNMLITTSNSIKLQSSSLVQLTESTNQLTRTTISIAANRCYQLTLTLDAISTRISQEDAQICARQLIQCASNLLTAVNGPLQKRIQILDLDTQRASIFPDDYDTDLESEWSKIKDFNEKNFYYQQKLANEISQQINEMIIRLTSILNIHINVGQQSIINTSNVFMSFESQTMESLSNKQFADGSIRLPTITNNSKNSVRIQSKIEPLAPFGSSSNTNLSRTISLSMFDSNGNEILLNDSIELFIPRDPNRILPSMILQNVTSMNSTFHFHYVNLTTVLSISIHIEIQPLNSSIAYLLFYKFDQIPRFNQIDGWTIFCPSNFLHTYFLDNQQTRNHQSLVFGLRELNSTELIAYCSNNSPIDPPNTNQQLFHFTSNYQLRIYSSGCYFLDKNNQWNDQGLRVGPLTNHNQTHCLT